MKLEPSRLFETITRFMGLLSDLEEVGIRVEVGDDFRKYRHHRAQCQSRAPIYPMFDIENSYIDRTNGFWVCAFEPGGELIHTQAIRLLSLQDISLDEHFKLHRQKYITPDSTPDPDKTTFVGPRALQEITGQVGYQGDFWLRSEGLAGPRSFGATALLSRVLLELASLAWSPSFIFALVPKKLAAKGAHLRYGYTHCEPGQWIGPDQQITEEDHLIWMSSDDLAALCVAAPPRLSSRGQILNSTHARARANDASATEIIVNE